MTRYLLLAVLGLVAVTSLGCRCRQHRYPCGSSIFPGRRALVQPIGVPVGGAPLAPMPYEGSPAGIPGGVPGCSSCGSGGGMGGYPVASIPSGGAPTYGGAPIYSGAGGIPHDSMLLHSPTVIPPGAGSPRIEIDPPKPMPMTGAK